MYICYNELHIRKTDNNGINTLSNDHTNLEECIIGAYLYILNVYIYIYIYTILLHMLCIYRYISYVHYIYIYMYTQGGLCRVYIHNDKNKLVGHK